MTTAWSRLSDDADPRPMALVPAGLAARAGVQSGVLTRDQLLAAGFSKEHVRAGVAARRWQAIGRRVVVLHNGELSEEQQRWVAVLLPGKLSRAIGTDCGRCRRIEWIQRRARPCRRGRRRQCALSELDDDPQLSAVQRGRRCQDHRGPTHETCPFCHRRCRLAALPSARRGVALRVRTTACDLSVGSRTRTDGWPEASGMSRSCAMCWATSAAGRTPSMSSTSARWPGAPVSVHLDDRRSDASPAGVRDTSTRSSTCLTANCLVVEVDGAVHLRPQTWWDDLSRQNEIVIGGSSVLRFSSTDVRLEPERVVDQLRRVRDAHQK